MFREIVSQCQAIHARSIFPCQDTPDVKATVSYQFKSPLPVVASDNKVTHGPLETTGTPLGDGISQYNFEQIIPIPSYLVAVASGDLKSASIGPRSEVVSGPEEVAQCKWELENDMEKFLEAAESIVFKYQWGTYNVLVLPSSFPYGGKNRDVDCGQPAISCMALLTLVNAGMENPIYTFATPTIISKDRMYTLHPSRPLSLVCIHLTD